MNIYLVSHPMALDSPLQNKCQQINIIMFCVTFIQPMFSRASLTTPNKPCHGIGPSSSTYLQNECQQIIYSIRFYVTFIQPMFSRASQQHQTSHAMALDPPLRPLQNECQQIIYSIMFYVTFNLAYVYSCVTNTKQAMIGPSSTE